VLPCPPHHRAGAGRLENASPRQFGPYLLDGRERVLRRGDETVALTPKAFDLLAAFVEQPGRLLSKDDLLKQVWPDTFVEESNLAYHVFVLRKALGESSGNGPYIETVPKRGYRFTAAVTPVNSADEAPEPVLDASHQASATAETPAPAVERVPRAPSFPVSARLGLVGVVLLPAIVLYLAAWTWRDEPDPEPLRPLPLTSLTGAVRAPSLSPDGKFVVFTWTPEGQANTDLYVQQIGTGVHRPLTTDPANDYSPSWSPDGLTIAFLRRGAGSHSEIRTIAPLGGPEKKVADISPSLREYGPSAIAWCPDSRCLLVSDSQGGALPAVFAVARDTGEKLQLTRPRTGGDSDPIISSDGRTLVYRHKTTPFSGPYYRLSLTDGMAPRGEPVQLTAEGGKPAWIPGTNEILFASSGGLWRLDVTKGGTPERLPFVGQDGHTPVVSRMTDGRLRLVYERSFSDGNVWRLDMAMPGSAASPPVAAIASTRGDYLPSLSPDGGRIAFISDRSGEGQIWVAGADGADPERLTSMPLHAMPGYPRWSPDGTTIAFMAALAGRPDVVIVRADGGQPQIRTARQPNAGWPNFSRDGQSLYFCVVQPTGPDKRCRIWKMPAAGGTAVPVTKDPGTLGIESHDRRDFYYVEGSDRPSTLWRVPVAGGTPVKVLDGVLSGQFDVSDGGIYFIDSAAPEAGAFFTDRPGGTRLRYFDIATKRISTVLQNVGWAGLGLSASADGRAVVFTRIDSSVNELTLVDGFR
jgi:Tol biopolymer transport system component/DNA-binding winged helix-turn-helix (wHTH) protein